jgi:ubiquitin-protein ligase
MSNKAIRRLQADLKEYHLSPIDGTSIYYDEECIKIIYVAIAGPKDSVYESGIYFFKFEFPDTYPNEPPIGKFMNWQNSNDRMHPNLYKCGKMCFSFLGTWSGPSWTSAMGLSTIILNLQTVLDENPLKNEPGYDKGTVSNEHITYQRIIQYLNIRDFILKPMKLCKSDEVIKNHEYLVNFKPFLLDYFSKNIKSIKSKFNILLDSNPNTQRLSINYQSTTAILDYPSITIELNTLEKLF